MTIILISMPSIVSDIEIGGDEEMSECIMYHSTRMDKQYAILMLLKVYSLYLRVSQITTEIE